MPSVCVDVTSFGFGFRGRSNIFHNISTSRWENVGGGGGDLGEQSLWIACNLERGAALVGITTFLGCYKWVFGQKDIGKNHVTFLGFAIKMV